MHWGRVKPLATTAGIAALLACVPGCAIVTQHADGSQRIVGFVAMEIKNPRAVEKGSGSEPLPGIDSVRNRMLGVSLLVADARTSLTLGYSDDTLIVVRSNSCVRIETVDGVPVRAAVGEPVSRWIFLGGSP